MFDRTNSNKDDITEAVHGLDIFTKNFCMNCKETAEKNELTFNCEGCEFKQANSVCSIKHFAQCQDHDYPMDNFGSMGMV